MHPNKFLRKVTIRNILQGLIFSLVLWLAACAPVAASTAQPTPDIAPATAVLMATVAPSVSASPSVSPAPTSTATSLPTATPTPTATFTPEPTASPVPTYAILRGVMLPEKVSCRYGPGWMYLYLYGLNGGAVQDIIGRSEPMLEQAKDGSWEPADWLLTRSRGDNKSCWVKAKFVDLQGDLASLEIVYPAKYTIPPSNQGYLPPWDVVAVRAGQQVTISWQSEAMRPGDEESPTSVQYVVETWVCRSGQLFFAPIGAYAPQVTIDDEAGCDQPSHGRVYFMEKHGYTGPTDIIWPQALP